MVVEVARATEVDVRTDRRGPTVVEGATVHVGLGVVAEDRSARNVRGVAGEGGPVSRCRCGQSVLDVDCGLWYISYPL